MMRTILLLLLAATAGWAAPVTVAWDHSPDVAQLQGYRLYQLLSVGRTMLISVNATVNQVTVELDDRLSHQLVVVGYDAIGLTDDSNVLVIPAARPRPPFNLRKVGTQNP
jgi:hypothetical protein